MDKRVLIVTGFILTSVTLREMSLFDFNITAKHVITNGIIQGFGLGFIFVPLSSLAFNTLASQFRNEGTAIFSLTRNIGSSIGISVIMTILAENIQANHAGFAQFINPMNLFIKPLLDQGIKLVDLEVNRQAAMLAYLQDFRLMMWITLIPIPLLFMLKNTNPTLQAQKIS